MRTTGNRNSLEKLLRIARFLWLYALIAIPTAACDAGYSSARENMLGDPNIPVWSLSATPLRSVQAVSIEGDSVPLYDVRHAIFRPAGGVVLSLGRGSNTILVLDSAGRVSRSLGGSGRGPGEFMDVTGIFGTAEGFAVWDGISRRVTVMTDSGRIATTTTLPGGRRVVVGLLDDTIFVTTASLFAPFADTTTVVRARAYTFWNKAGDSIGSVVGAVEPPSSIVRLEFISDGVPSQTSTSLDHCLPEILHATMGGEIVVADASKGTVRWLTASGATAVLFSHFKRPVVTRETTQRIRHYLASIESNKRNLVPLGPPGTKSTPNIRLARGEVEQVVALVGDPGSPLPSFWSAAMVADSAHLWLRKATCFDGKEEVSWEVVARSGQVVAQVSVPRDTRLLAAAENRVLAVVRDTLGVEFFSTFDLHRNAAN